jgi:hypothetical protein
LQAASAAPAILAYHAARAGLTHAAFEYSLTAGDAALRLFAVRDAIAFYEQAHQGLAEWFEHGSPEANTFAASWQQLYTQLGRAYELDNQFDKARETYQAMLGLAQSLGEPALEWTALNRLATVATLGSFDLEAALALLHEARQVAERSGDQAGLAETEWNLAQASFYQMDWTAALAHGESALARARELELAELSARCLNVIAHANNGLHDWAAVEAAHEEALSLAERIPGQVFVALAAAELCADAALLGAWIEAHQYAIRAAGARPHSLAYVGFTGWLEMEALLRGGDSALANEVMHWLSQHARTYPHYQLAQLRCQAVLARWEARNMQAQEYLQAASTVAAELNLRASNGPFRQPWPSCTDPATMNFERA